MKHKGKIILAISLVFVALWGIGIAIKFLNPPKKCVDYFEIDEAKLQQVCSVTKQELQDRLKIDPNFCPRKTESYIMKGGCTPEYGLAAIELILPTVVWFGVLGAVLLFIGIYNPKRKQK